MPTRADKASTQYDEQRPSDPSVHDVWDALIADPSIGVAIIDHRGHVRFCNDRFAEFYLGADTPAKDCLGMGWARDIGQSAMNERLEVLDAVRKGPGPLAVRTILRGHQLLLTINRIPPASGDEDRFLYVMRRVAGSAKPNIAQDVTYYESRSIDLGPLAALSSRELEVLALLGQGLTSREIGKILHRAEKTVENHRYSIGKKLTGTHALAIAEIARQAGLTVEDARRPGSGGSMADVATIRGLRGNTDPFPDEWARPRATSPPAGYSCPCAPRPSEPAPTGALRQ